MGLETFNLIEDLVAANPNGDPDEVLDGDNHIRGVKLTLQNQFPSLGATPITKTGAEINALASQTELTDGLATKIGTDDFAGETVGGTLKLRLDGTTLYITNTVTDP